MSLGSWLAVAAGVLLWLFAGLLIRAADWWSLESRIVIGVALALLGLLLIVGMVPGATAYVAAAGWAWLIVLIWVVAWLLVWIDRVNTRVNFVDEPSVIALSLGAIAIILFAAVYLRGRLPGDAAAGGGPDGDSADEGEGGGDRIRAAIATTFIVVFLLLVVDLLTIPGFRGSLSDVEDVAVTATGTETSSTVGTVPCPSPSPSLTDGSTGVDVAPTESPSTEGVCETTSAVAVSFVEGLFGVFKWAITAIVIFYFGAGAVASIANAKERTKQANVKAGMTPAGEVRSDAPVRAADADGGGAVPST